MNPESVRTGRLMQFLHRNLFRVQLSNGVSVVAVMSDELLPSFDVNVQLTKYNRPPVDVDLRESPQLPKIIAIAIHPDAWCGPILRKFWKYEV